MKKAITILLITALLAALTLPASAAELTTADALTVLRVAAGLTTLPAEEMTRLGLSGTVTTADALRILRVAAGLPANAPAARVGEIIRFGDYDWRVLHTEDGRALIITEKVLYEGSYASSRMTWGDSENKLRAWLNDVFFNEGAGFSAAEKSRIIEVTNSTPDNLWTYSAGGNDTRDKIFLLSIEDVLKYFGDSGDYAARRGDGERSWDSSREVFEYVRFDGTEPRTGDVNRPGRDIFGGASRVSDIYNESRIAYGWDETHARKWFGPDTPTELRVIAWRLRSPGNYDNHTAYVSFDGAIEIFGDTNFRYSGVRPAMWITL